MMILRITLVAALCFCSAQAVLNKELKRRDGFDSYGPPPRPAPQYGPPPSPQRQPHREYGVPQKIPFQEYGPPALKYGPPKLNFLHSSGSSGSSQNHGFYEQIKSHFGVPKPIYGPPHRPQQSYGPPPHQPQQQYGPPPHQPQPQYGPPKQQFVSIQQHRPQPNYGPPPKPVYGPPPPPQALPLRLPSPAFKPEHQPASSYGPPPSGPIHPPQQSYGPPPQQSYGAPQLPVNLPNFNRGQEATIVIATGGGNHHHGHHQFGGEPAKQIQIQIDAAGHTHSVSGSQSPFHTACDGWKPIPAPVGSFVEHNNIETQGGYSSVQHGVASNGFVQTQYSSNAGDSSSGGGSSIVDGLTDEQLVAIALQSDSPKGGSNILGISQSGSHSHDNFNNNQKLNSIDTDALQLSLASFDDSYSKPPSDSFAPGSVHAQKFNGAVDSYGAPPSGNFGPPPQQQQQHQEDRFNNFPPQVGSQPNRPVAYRPPVPQGLLESIGASVAHLEQFGVKPPQQPPTYIPPAVNEIPASGPGNVENEYGPPPPLPPIQALPLEAKPPQEIIEQQLPQARPPQFLVQVNQQQPPQQYQGRQEFISFQQQQQHQQQHQQQQIHNQQRPQLNFLPQFQEPRNQYVPPPPPLPLGQPPQSQYLPPPPPPQEQQQQQRPLPPHAQYLPPPFPAGSNPSVNYQHQHQQTTSQFTSAGAASAINEQFIHTQGLPLQQNVQFNQVPHNCGHGPNLIGANFQIQQQQQQGQFQDQQHYASAGSSNAYNAITQSIPVAESHSQFLETPDNSYGPPSTGNDHEGYASQHNGVAALPDGTNPHDLPGLEGLNGLNVISAQKSQSIDISAGNNNQQQHQQSQHKYQLELTENPGSQGAQHEEILSQGLLQSILSAIEEPKSQIAPNHNYANVYDAQSRSDMVEYENEQDETAVAEPSEKTEVKTEVVSEAKSGKEAKVTKIMPIVAEEIPEAE